MNIEIETKKSIIVRLVIMEIEQLDQVSKRRKAIIHEILQLKILRSYD